MNVYIFEMPFLICDLCKVRKNCAGKGFVEDSTVQCLMVSAILHIPKCANPNSIFFVKHCFGFVFVLEDVDQSTSSFFGAS